MSTNEQTFKWSPTGSTSREEDLRAKAGKCLLSQIFSKYQSASSNWKFLGSDENAFSGGSSGGGGGILAAR